MKGVIKLSLLVLIVFFACAMQAQHCDGSNRTQGFHLLQMLQKHAEISAEQSAAIKEILSAQKSKIATLKNNFAEGDSKEKIKSAIQQIKAEADVAIVEILTDEQVVLYQEIKEKRKDRGGKNFGIDKADRAERKAKFLAMRIELEEAISRKDKKKIKSLRKTMKAATSEKKAFFAEWKANNTKPSEEEMQAAAEIWKEKYEKEWAAVQVLVKKYDAAIQAIFDKHKIGQSGKGVCSGDKGERGDKADCEWKDKADCCTKEANTPDCCKGKMGKKGKMKARFLLMNPKGAGEDVSKAAQEEIKVSTVKISPNPVKANATIAYEVKNEGIIKIDLVDESGNFVDNLLNEYKKEGAYQLNFNTNTLQSKMYFIAIRDEVGVSNEKLLINKR